MTDAAICLLFLAAAGIPFLASLLAIGWHWLTDLAWRQWP